MAGLFGCFSRVPRPRTEIEARLEGMRAMMSSRASHRSVMHVAECGAFGAIGPGILDGTMTVHVTAPGRALVADGELYHMTDGDGHAVDGNQAWTHLDAMLAGQSAPVLSEVDGIFSAARLSADAGPALTLFNDRYGSRRLYYTEVDDWFVFASEMAPLAAWLGGRSEIDWAAVQDSLSFGSPIGDATWLQGIRLFPPATLATVTSHGTSWTRYWRWSDVPEAGTNSRADRFDELHHLWRRAIAARVHGRRVGLQLSGGLDSRLILGEALTKRTDLVATTYGEPGADDVRFARQCAEAAGVRWFFWPLPGSDWLERRATHTVEHDGIVDIANAHHAGLVDAMGTLFDVELSGYLGDALMGATGVGFVPDAAAGMLPYWESPISIPAEVARDRIAAAVAGAGSVYGWMLENKWRRATNAWPHLAVNALEVRKPFVDYALVEFCAGLPDADRRLPPQRELLRRFYPELARVPWQKTGVSVGGGAAAIAGMRAVRVAYRTGRRVANSLGWQAEPWIRNACNVTAWCDSSTRQTITESVTSRSAVLREKYGEGVLRETLDAAFDRRTVPVEVPLNLYRAERVLRRLRSIASGDDQRV